jgi:hypothetical protein
MLKAQMHPVLAGAQGGLQHLSVIQQQLLTRKESGERSSAAKSYKTVLGIMQHMSQRQPKDANPYRTGGGKGTLRGRLSRASHMLEESRQALAEIQDSIPKPHQRMLATKAALQEAFKAAYGKCRSADTWEYRTLESV